MNRWINNRRLTVHPPVFLAPMAGVTDSPFRSIARGLGCPAVVTGMISAAGIVRRTKGSLALLRYDPSEHPIIAQIFGSSPEVMAEAARHCAEMGFDGLDLNLGCPVRKVVNTGAGAALMHDPERAVQITTAVRRAVSLPLSVKLRSGWSASEINLVSLAGSLADTGIDALVVHPRTRSQFYGGRADWHLIGQVVESVEIPVIGNGDLIRPEDGLRMMRETGCSGVMVGRAALGDPWLPSAMACRLAGAAPGTGAAYPPGPEERLRIFLMHLQKMVDWCGSQLLACRRMRKHAVWYTRRQPGAVSLRRALPGIDTVDEMKRQMASLLLGKDWITLSNQTKLRERSTPPCP